MEKITGTQITNVYTHYENICVVVDGKVHFLSTDELTKILNEFDFISETKKTRNWLNVDFENSYKYKENE